MDVIVPNLPTSNCFCSTRLRSKDKAAKLMGFGVAWTLGSWLDRRRMVSCRDQAPTLQITAIGFLSYLCLQTMTLILAKNMYATAVRGNTPVPELLNQTGWLTDATSKPARF